eukprot:Pgem_evm1s18270
MLSISALPNIENLPLHFAAVMVVIAFGSGAIKPNIPAFGADQYDIGFNPNLEKEDFKEETKRVQIEKKEQENFFSIRFFFINVATFLAFGYLPYLATKGNGAIAEDYGYAASYFICLGAVILAFVLFLIRSPKYKKAGPEGNALQGLVYYVSQGAVKSKNPVKGKLVSLGWVGIICFLILALAQSFVVDDQMATILSYTDLAI